jgi:hypothetical protein
MALIRTGLVIACGVALLPADKAEQERLFKTATETATWAATYCTREPQKCEQAGQLWEGLKEKAAFAAKLAVETSQTYAANAPQQASQGDGAQVLSKLTTLAKATTVAALPVSRDTLTRDDLGPTWRGPRAR